MATSSVNQALSRAGKTPRLLLSALVLLCIVFIFFNSSRSGAASGATSQQITAAITGQEVTEDDTPLENAVRKAGHLAEYSLLGLLLGLWLRAWRWATRLGHAGVLLFGHLVATLDECLQTTVPGRNGAVYDVWIDMAGLVAGLLLAGLAVSLWRKKRLSGLQ